MSYRISGTIMVEFSFGIFSVILVLFIIVGVINGSLDRLITNSNFKNITGANTFKAYYQSLGREYQNFTVYVK